MTRRSQHTKSTNVETLNFVSSLRSLNLDISDPYLEDQDGAQVDEFIIRPPQKDLRIFVQINHATALVRVLVMRYLQSSPNDVELSNPRYVHSWRQLASTLRLCGVSV